MAVLTWRKDAGRIWARGSLHPHTVLAPKNACPGWPPHTNMIHVSRANLPMDYTRIESGEPRGGVSSP